jgi:hypothetical protein
MRILVIGRWGEGGDLLYTAVKDVRRGDEWSKEIAYRRAVIVVDKRAGADTADSENLAFLAPQ